MPRPLRLIDLPWEPAPPEVTRADIQHEPSARFHLRKLTDGRTMIDGRMDGRSIQIKAWLRADDPQLAGLVERYPNLPRAVRHVYRAENLLKAFRATDALPLLADMDRAHEAWAAFHEARQVPPPPPPSQPSLVDRVWSACRRLLARIWRRS